jgi:hypothetical protein
MISNFIFCSFPGRCPSVFSVPYDYYDTTELVVRQEENQNFSVFFALISAAGARRRK